MDDTELDEVESQKNSVNLTIEIPELSTDIQELEKKVNSIFNNDVTSMLEKSKQLLEIKDDIKKEQDNINYMIDKISDLSPKKSKKFCKDTYSQKGFYN